MNEKFLLDLSRKMGTGHRSYAAKRQRKGKPHGGRDNPTERKRVGGPDNRPDGPAVGSDSGIGEE